MSAEAFFDTNVLIYALAQSDPRAAVAERLLFGGGKISIQVLNEFASVARRKLGLPWPDVDAALWAVRALCEAPVPLTIEIHEAALALVQRDNCSFYDALIVAAALDAGCKVLYSEDLQDGRWFDGRLRVCNPFKA